MAYIKQNFQNGEVLNAEELNHMEDGIYANDQAITSFDEQKADKATSATQNDFAKFDSTGNPIDSGISVNPPMDNGEYYLTSSRNGSSVTHSWETKSVYRDSGNGNIVINS